MKILFPLLFLLIIFACEKDGNNQENNVLIEISPAELKLGYEASLQEISVESNVEWGVNSSQNWCKVSEGGGLSGITIIHITLEKNETDTARSAVLTFRSGSYKKEFKVTQAYLLKEVSFDDNGFKQYCIDQFDTDHDGKISLGEASTVTDLNVSGTGISSLGGIESFNSLVSLNCSNNNLTKLNVTGLSALKTLDCSSNQLDTINLQMNVNLTSLNCTGNSFLRVIYVWTGFVSNINFIKPDAASYIEPEIPTPVGYSLVWQDEFNDPREGGKAVLPSATNWSFETGNHGWGNNELQNYVAGISGTDTCAKIYNRSLKIVAKKVGSQVLSVRMNSTQSWLYGYFEARLKLPVGKGTWPAFWMLPKNFTAWPDDGEIDIMEEVGYNPNYISSSIHCKAYYHSIGTQKTAEKHVPTAQTEFHVYAVEWTEDFIKGYIDGVKYFEFNNDHQGNKNTWPFNVPFYLKLNLAWGGNWGGAQGVDETCLPATYEVDYVRVFQKK